MSPLTLEPDETTRLRHNSQSRGNLISGRTKLERALLLLLAAVIVVGIGLSIALASYYRAANKSHKQAPEEHLEKKRCATPACIATANRLLESMDQTVDPCEDFYSFCCGGFDVKHLQSNFYSRFTQLNVNILDRIKVILEEKINDSIPEHEKKVKQFYRTCINMGKRDKIGAEPLLKDLKELGGWPLLEDHWNATEFNWVDMMVKLYEMGYQNDILVTVRVHFGIRNVSDTLIYIDQPSFGMGVNYINYMKSPLSEAVAYYKNYVRKVAHLLEPDLSSLKSKKEIDEAMEIELRLANASLNKIEHRYPAEIYRSMTLEELENYAPKIPWKDLLERLLPGDVDLQDDEKLLVLVPSAIKELNQILREYDTPKGQKILANYMFYRIATAGSENLNYAFYQAYQDMINLIRKTPYVYEPPGRVCADLTMTIFHRSISSIYIKKFFNEETRESFTEMFKDIQKALMELIQDANWMDPKTRSYALYKVNLTCSAIGYPDELMDDQILNEYFENITITENHYDNVKSAVYVFEHKWMNGLHEKKKRFEWNQLSNILTANAFYMPTQNAITIPVGILQKEVYDPEAPNYSNYGGLGSIIGHEMTHAFDAFGSKYDAKGNYREWWDKETWNKLLERNKCFVEQYNNYTDPILNVTVNGTRTLSENIADNGGLRAAYMGYKKWIKRHKIEPELPGLSYTWKQLFWIAFGSFWCRHLSENGWLMTYESDLHSPAPFRVQGALSNMEEFAKDFKCKIGTAYNPREKCYLWR